MTSLFFSAFKAAIEGSCLLTFNFTKTSCFRIIQPYFSTSSTLRLLNSSKLWISARRSSMLGSFLRTSHMRRRMGSRTSQNFAEVFRSTFLLDTSSMRGPPSRSRCRMLGIASHSTASPSTLQASAIAPHEQASQNTSFNPRCLEPGLRRAGTLLREETSRICHILSQHPWPPCRTEIEVRTFIHHRSARWTKNHAAYACRVKLCTWAAYTVQPELHDLNLGNWVMEQLIPRYNLQRRLAPACTKGLTSRVYMEQSDILGGRIMTIQLT